MSSNRAASSSLADLEYSFGSGLSESLCCVSLRAATGAVRDRARMLVLGINGGVRIGCARIRLLRFRVRYSDRAAILSFVRP